eukprot:9688038-Karenia_brevis.AAC.1
MLSCLVAPVKPCDENDAGIPDVRPLGLGEYLRHLTHPAVVVDHREEFEKFFWPQQVAVGIPS